MSVIIHPRGEVGGGVAAHLQCPHCGHFSRSHAHQLTHMAATHPSCLDDVTVGRLGNILMYQSDARLFHCGDCFYTSRDFTKIYKHLISKHCTDQPDGDGDGGEDEEDEGGKDTGRMKRSTEVKEEEEEEEVKDEMRRSSKVKEEEEEVKDDGEMKRSSEVKVKEEKDDDGERSVLMFDGAGYRCLICGWRHKLKAVGVNHVVRKHDIPKAYAAQAVRRDAAAANQKQGGGAEEEEEAVALSSELLREEKEVTAKVVRWISNRFVCLICGHKTKLKGFAISHVVRCHDVERPYSCKECQRSFFLPSRLQQHVRAAHRPGRYACPFCCFRSHFLGGFRRHCSRCNAREEGEDGGGGAGGAAVAGEEEEHEEDEDEDTKETRGRRKRRRTERLVEEDDED